MVFVLKLEISYETTKNIFSLSSYGKDPSSVKSLVSREFIN